MSQPSAAELDAEALELEAELLERDLARDDLYYFVKRMQDIEAPFKDGWHIRELCDVYMKMVEAVINHDTDAKQYYELKYRRIMVQMPPRHAKSFTTSKCLPLWFLAKYPNKEVIVAGYGQEFINDFGTWAKGIVIHPEFLAIFPDFEVRKDSKAKNRLVTPQGGGIRYAGAGSAITGRGAHLFVIDDPIKGEKEADSEISIEDLWKWYWGVARTRLHPGGAIIVMHTRWRTNDLIGMLLKQQEEKKVVSSKRWQFFNYPAVAEEDEPHRKKGEALHPGRYNLEELEELMENMPERQWLALYQQRPVAEKGNFFNTDHIQLYSPHKLPPLSEMYIYIAGDIATKEKEENDYTCIWPYGVDNQGNIWFLPDFFHDKCDIGVATDVIFDMLERYNKLSQVMHVALEAGVIRNCMDPLIAIKSNDRKIYPCIESPPTSSDKITMAKPAQGMFQMGKIFIPDIQRVHFTVLPEMLAFPVGDNDDIVDTIGLAARCVQNQIAPSPLGFIPEDGELEDDEDEDGIYDGPRYEGEGWTYKEIQERCYEPPEPKSGSPSLFSGEW